MKNETQTTEAPTVPAAVVALKGRHVKTPKGNVAFVRNAGIATFADGPAPALKVQLRFYRGCYGDHAPQIAWAYGDPIWIRAEGCTPTK